jgi:outer membrane autotransporter protein
MNRLDHDSVWLQEIGFAVKRDAPDFGVDYEGHGFGFAAGFDGPLADGLLLGLSMAFTATEAEEDGREGNVTAALGQLNAYLGGGLGPLEWDLIGGGGIGKMNSRREVRLGSDFSATSEGDWLMYEGHGQAQLGLPVRLGDRFTIRPRASIVYVGLNEEAYEEEGGGAAVDVAVGESTMQRVWADGVIDLSWRMGGAAGVTPRLTFGYRTNIVDDPAEREVHFAHAGAADFTLVDEILGDGGALFGFSLTGGNEHSTVSIMYEGEFSDTIDRHSLNASLRIRF